MKITLKYCEIALLVLGILLLTACSSQEPQNKVTKLSYIEDVDSMAEYAREYLEDLDLCNVTMFGDFLTAMQDCSVEYKNETLAFYWIAKVDHLHDVSWYRIETFWEYDEVNDNWILRKNGDVNYWEGYDVEVEFQKREFKQVDFSGIWCGEGAYEGFTIEIYDFSWEKFSANIPQFNVKTQDFVSTTSVSGDISIYSGEFFTNGNGEYICFYPQDTYTTIIYQERGNNLWAVKINSVLPELK